MLDTERQAAGAKVLWHFVMSVDGFVAGPDHAMDRMTGFSVRPGLHAEYLETTGAVLAGRSGFDSAIGDSRPLRRQPGRRTRPARPRQRQ